MPINLFKNVNRKNKKYVLRHNLYFKDKHLKHSCLSYTKSLNRSHHRIKTFRSF